MALSEQDKKEIQEMVTLAVAATPRPQRRRSVPPPSDVGMQEVVAHGRLLIVPGAPQSRYHRVYLLDTAGCAYYTVGVRKDTLQGLMIEAIATGTGENLDPQERSIELHGEFPSKVRAYYGK